MDGERITAVLGPTNTGKTYLAIERMLAHDSGMIGLPLRLLAREVYDKILRMRGPSEVALITGEERIVPARPRYFVCTVEAMPIDIPVAFLAVDEIQLCADPERGHVFTDRLLHARGLEETMLLGAATMRRAIQHMVPQARFVTRPRFSDLAYTGHKKLTRLPRRSAIVAFSAENVYGIADLVRGQRGGAAIVMGALSPRTRNAQVALYQSGEADFLIATDAIGMGINIDVDHLAFAALDKFDGAMLRPLRADEIGQIAGRAGRYMNDGTFGVSADADSLEAELIARVENHHYDPVRVLQWRNSALDFSSTPALLASLEVPPPRRGLIRARTASDHWTLSSLFQDQEIRDMASARTTNKLLWETCQLPDFRNLTPDEHARLVGEIFRHLIRRGALPEDWLARQIQRLDISDGDVDTLSARLAQIRTWTYVAHRPNWTDDPAHWQERTRAVEDRLSDALHEKLTQRFLDRRTSVLMRSLREQEFLALRVDESGAVSIGATYAGKLDGFRFAADPRAEGIHGRTLRAAALKGLEAEVVERAGALITEADTAIRLSEHARLWWRGSAVAKLAAGAHPLTPSLALLADDLVKGNLRDLVQERLERWTHAHVANLLAPLVALRNAAEGRNRAGNHADLSGLSRGLAYQLAEGLGKLKRQHVESVGELREAAHLLRPFGVRLGRHAIFLPRLLKPAASALVALLWAVHSKLEPVPPPPAPGLTSFAVTDQHLLPFLEAAFYRPLGDRAVRLDIVERMEETLAGAARGNRDGQDVVERLASLLGCSFPEAEAAAGALGWNHVAAPGPAKGQGNADAGDHGLTVWRRTGGRNAQKRKNGRADLHARGDTPFAKLASLIASN